MEGISRRDSAHADAPKMRGVSPHSQEGLEVFYVSANFPAGVRD
jgi:hypothetical protein